MKGFVGFESAAEKKNEPRMMILACSVVVIPATLQCVKMAGPPPQTPSPDFQADPHAMDAYCVIVWVGPFHDHGGIVRNAMGNTASQEALDTWHYWNLLWNGLRLPQLLLLCVERHFGRLGNCRALV